MIKKINIQLLILLTLAFFLRFVSITESPPSLNWDEVSIGYNAYSILKTGKDEWGRVMPLHFESYGEYKLPVQIYASIPAILIFGLNSFGVRITPVIYGTLSVLLLYFITKKLFKRAEIGLLALLFLAISPWHIQFTRASFESSFSVFWILIGIWFFLKGFEEKRWFIFSTIPFAISVYTYNSARVFTPLFLLVVSFVYLKDFIKKPRIIGISVLLFFVLMIPLIPFVLSGKASARYKLVSIINEQGLIPRINETRGLSKLPKPLPRLIYNKVTFISFYFTRNYLAHFSLDFLFIRGALHKQHSVQGMGELYKIQAPFLLIGLYLIIKRKEKYRWLLISWLLIAFIPVATTRDSIPNALRTLIAVPVYQIITAYGLIYLFSKLKSTKAKCIIAILTVFILAIEVGNYINNYFRIYPIKYSRDWQYGYKEVVSYIKDHYSDYDLIVFSRVYGEPHMFTLFYLNFPPSDYINNPNLVRFKANDWVWVTSFDKFYFPNLSDRDSNYNDIFNKNKNKKILFIGRPGDFGGDINLLKTIYFLDGSPAFVIVKK